MLGFLKPIARRLATWILVHGREELEQAVAAEIAKRTASPAIPSPTPGVDR